MRLLSASMLLILSCKTETPTPADKPEKETEEIPPLERAEQAATSLGQGLKQRLQAAIQAGGPVEAISVCNVEAQGIPGQILDQTGVRVGRSSLRLRNPANHEAPDWVREWLSAQGERKAEGVQGIARLETLPDGSAVARVLKPIAMEPLCLNCHGPKETLMPAVAERIASLYPEDRATGYAEGDLRGALWAEYPVPTSAP